MASPKFPNLLRYWFARLRPLTHPQFWVPLSGAAFLGLFGWAVMQQHDWLSALSPKDSAPPEDQSEAEGLAIGADIDSLPVLLNQVGTSSDSTQPPSPDGSPAKPSGSSGQSSILEILKTISSPSLAGSAPAVSNASAAPLGFFEGTLPSGNGSPLLGTRSIGGLGSSAMSQGTGSSLLLAPETSQATAAQDASTIAPAPSALATAISQLNASTSPSDSSITTPGTSTSGAQWGTSSPSSAPLLQGSQPLSTTGFSPSLPVQGTTGMTSTGFSSGNVPNAYTQLEMPQTTAPTTSTTTPSAIAPVPLPSTSSIPQQTVLPGVSDATAAAQSQGTPQTAPFSIPRNPPGRYIGGGKINTFSNP